MNYTVDEKELRKAMISAGYNTIIDLSNASDVDRNTIGGILNGKVRPTSTVIEKLARALSLSGADIGLIFFKNKLS